MAYFYRKNTVKVEFQGSKVNFWGSNLYGPRLFIDSKEVVETHKKDSIIIGKKTTSRFYRKNTVNIVFQMSKVMLWGSKSIGF